MKLTVTSWSFPACTLSEAWGVATAIGFTAMDVGLLHGAALDRGAILADPEAAADDLSAKGIKASNLYWLFGASPFERPLTDLRALPKNAADFEKVAAFAKAIGAPTIFVLPGVATPGESQKSLIAASAECFSALMPIAEAHGVTLT
ncbi:MAG: sugar phosphate isomerase/epimerase, partial [Pseudomonadota bacterium]